MDCKAPQRKKEYDRAYHSTPEYKAANAARMRLRRRRQPEDRAKRRAYMATYRKKQSCRAYHARYHREHRTQHREYNKNYRKKYGRTPTFRERARTLHRNYIHAHPEIARENRKKRRALKAGAPGSHTITQWLARVEFYGWRCAYCVRPLTIKTLTQDHRIPLSRGGSNFASNLVPACSQCNSSKGNRWIS